MTRICRPCHLRSLRGGLLLGLAPALLLLLAPSCGDDPGDGSGATPPTPETVFVDRADDTGVDFVNHTGVPGEKKWLFESKGGGILVLDYDGDGRVDLYAVDGNSIELDESGRLVSRTANPAAGNRLYRNLGDWKFRDVTEEAGVGDASFGVSGTVGDYDNDGDPDIYVCNWGANRLYRNEGDGTFTDVTARAGVAGGDELFSTCAAFFDADRDGDLDLYVTNYGDASRLIAETKGEPPGDTRNGMWLYAGPGCYAPQPDLYFENLGDGTFRDATAEAFPDMPAYWGFQPIPLDADNDGDPDLYVANDSMPNFLWINDGTGRFEDRAWSTGVAMSAEAYPQAGMGVDAGDYDQDGWTDLVVTNFSADQTTLYRNAGAGERLFFEDLSDTIGLTRATMNFVSWGVAFRDFDHDGFLDLFIVNGGVYPTDAPETRLMDARYEEAPCLLLGSGPPGWTFSDVSAVAGPALTKRGLGRGAAFADLDGDGDEDLAVACLNQPLRLIENRFATKGHWLRLRLTGTKSNRDAIGARVTVTAGREQMREHRLASSFGATQGPSMHFGLGGAGRVDRLEVLWPSGERQLFTGLEADRSYTIREGAKSAVPR